MAVGSRFGSHLDQYPRSYAAVRSNMKLGQLPWDAALIVIRTRSSQFVAVPLLTTDKGEVGGSVFMRSFSLLRGCRTAIRAALLVI
jgi:hypothetical protein